MSFTSKRVAFLLPWLLGLAAGCGGSNLVLPSEGVAAKIVVASGDKQAGVVGVPLVGNIVVRVTDSKDRPVQSQQVTFTPADASSGQAVPPSATTNADGQVSVQWVLGAVAGTQTMLAKAVGNGAPANLSVIITATASSSVPAKLEKVAGDGQTATAGAAVSIAPAVKVSDAQGNPVAGVPVTFAIATGAGSVNPTTAVPTNATGIAAVTSWTLGAVAGTNTLTATIPGSGVAGNPATFTATGVPGSAGQLAMNQQPSAAAQSGTPFTQQPTLQVQDARGNPVKTAGIAVTAAIASGSGGTLIGQVTVSTDNKGVATFTNLGITGAQGIYSISFTNPSLTGVTSAPITLTAGAPAQLAITTQPPAAAQSGVLFNPQPIVQVQDGQGNAVAQPGIAVTASLNGTGGSLGGTKTVNTDGTGSAAFTDLLINGSSGAYTITFSAPSLAFATSTTIAIGAGVPTQLAFTQQPSNVAAGAAITPAVQVSIEDGSGNIVANATNQVTVAIGNNPGASVLSGTLTVSAVSGVATFANLSLNKSGNGYTLVATSGSLAQATSGSFNVRAGPATQIAANSATSQSGQVSAAVPAPPSVIVRDANGNPVSGVAVTFAVTSGGGSISPTSPIATNSSGIATLTSWTLGPNPGSNQVTAAVSGLSGSPVTFDATGVAALSITTTSPLPAGEVGVAYSTTLSLAGGSAPYTWSVTSGSLPAGLSPNPSTGVISGTPTSATTANFTIQVMDATSATATKSFQLTITAVTITTTSLPGGSVGNSYSQTLSAVGGQPPYTWAVTVGSLPPGLALSPATGAITGTPTTTAGSPFGFMVKATDQLGGSDTQGLSIGVAQGATTTTLTQVSPATATAGSQITVTVSVTAAVGTPTGRVNVDDGAGNPIACFIPDISAAQTCSFTSSSVPGSYTATATYLGDSNYNGSSDATGQGYTLQ